MTLEALKLRPRKILASMAKRNGIAGWHSMTKPELVPRGSRSRFKERNDRLWRAHDA